MTLRRVLALIVALAAMAGLSCARSNETAFAPEPARKWARPLTNRTFARTAEQRSRGRYLAEGALQCAMCHSERAWDQPGAPPVAGRAFAGQIMQDDSLARIVAPNLTPDRETGAGRWSDDMLARAIREGVGHDGRALNPQMWYSSFRALSDDDVAAVVVYLRSLPPVRNALPPTRMTEKRRASLEADLEPLTTPVPAVVTTDARERGHYLAKLADCTGCHTSWYSSRQPGLLSGGNRIVRGTRSAWSTNITPDSSGIGGWDRATFIEVVRTGKGGILDPIMPWVVFRNLSDDDLAAIFTFLQSMAPASHFIDNHSAPTRCAACEQQHGMGEFNRLAVMRGIDVDARTLDACVGTFRSSEYHFTRVVTRTGRHLYGREDDGPRIELIALTPRRFKAPGWIAPVTFVADSTGRIVRMLSHEEDNVVLDRVAAGAD